MALRIGIDIGSISMKMAVIGDASDAAVIERLADTDHFSLLNGDNGIPVAISEYRRVRGRPLALLDTMLTAIRKHTGTSTAYIAVTGSGGSLVKNSLGAPQVNEFAAIVEAVNRFYPETRTVFEIGGESSKFILLGHRKDGDPLGILDYGTNGDCAAGTGAFMDQQAGRLKYSIEDVGGIVDKAEKAAQIAGRCSVFAKSDMIHAQQRGYSPEEVLKGLCNAVARNFKSAITRSRKVVPPVLMTGGVSMNSGMVRAVREMFELDEKDMSVPEATCWLGAIGCALKAESLGGLIGIGGDAEQVAIDVGDNFSDRLTLDKVKLLREKVQTREVPKSSAPVDAYLGIDIGSVSTNLVVIDTEGHVLKEIYTRTNARPIEVVGEGLKDIAHELSGRINVKGVGTTGSGRELIGILIGADTINDEITAHKTGALHISRGMLGKDVDTIFEIGGQDSKFIAIEDGVVVDFTMNDACAAGTGSFLEEQAQELDVNIIGEFARLALSSKHPLRLGERCTVFMGRDVNWYMQRGAAKEDVIAGLAYSVVHNYLNRVVRDRKIGDTIFFQGGTAYNDAVAAAFSRVTGKDVIVPPHNGVMGAIGAALLAKRKMDALHEESSFKGFDLGKIDYHLREFTCKSCSNFCTIQEFTVDGEKTYWGDKCSERYRKRKKSSKVPVVGDLYKIRDNLLRATYKQNGDTGPTIGIPMSMYTFDRLPFYNTYLTGCGFCTVLSEATNTTIANKGIETVVAEPCYPITVAHGHLKSLIESGVDHIWLPNILSAETDETDRHTHVCVWGSTLPFVAKHCPTFHPYAHKLLSPAIHFRDGERVVKQGLYESVRKFGVSRSQSDRAVDNAYRTQKEFRSSILDEGRRAVSAVKEAGEKAIVLVGRPYNIYDRAVNLSVASKLATIYGINVIPMEFIDSSSVDIDHVNNNMYWNYGRRILQTAVKLADDPHFDLIYITNFKCGPDSFVKQYVKKALGRPFLVLQFDGHSNDAGMMTRCEAYLDSKGFLSSWENKCE